MYTYMVHQLCHGKTEPEDPHAVVIYSHQLCHRQTEPTCRDSWQYWCNALDSIHCHSELQLISSHTFDQDCRHHPTNDTHQTRTAVNRSREIPVFHTSSQECGTLRSFVFHWSAMFGMRLNATSLIIQLEIKRMVTKWCLWDTCYIDSRYKSCADIKDVFLISTI